jgi:hypothetical protein
MERTMATASTAISLYIPSQLWERTIHRRGVEAAIWGMPAVSYELMYQEMVRKAGGGFNQIVYWSRLLDWRNQTLTPNPDVVYLMPFINTRVDGPMVLEIPATDEAVFNGSVMNLWQAALHDIEPAGVATGEGGKYLILPPGYDRSRVPPGYVVLAADTYQGFAVIRSLLESADAAAVAKAVRYGTRIKLYALADAGNPSPTTFVDASDVIFDSTIPYDIRFFESLNRIVQAEPWLDRDRVMIDQLKTIGIERGKPFKPDARTQRILNDAMVEARATLDEIYGQARPFYDGGNWVFPVTDELHESVANFFTGRDSYPVDARAMLSTLAFFSARHVGDAHYYLIADRDRTGRPLDGSATYMVRVPSPVPVTQYWSMTVYNRDTHSFIRKAEWVGRSSRTPGVKINADGSVDVYFAPSVPLAKRSNWIPTDPHGRFEVVARFYGPQKALFDKTWKLPGIERL